MYEDSIEPGCYLVASPQLFDPNFRRTVVLICEHQSEGSVGLVVNRPTPVTLDQVIPDFELPGIPVQATAGDPGTVFSGGPVEGNRLMVLRRGTADDGVQEICSGMHLVADISNTLESMKLSAPDLTQYRFFLGYAGWGKGQLDSELQQESWLVRPPDEGLLIDEPADDAWAQALRDLGGEYSLFAEMPHDPGLN